MIDLSTSKKIMGTVLSKYFQNRILAKNNLLKPVYPPKRSIEEVDGKQILVLWVPDGANRPYEVSEQIMRFSLSFFSKSIIV